jgi:hypothetical protein
MELILKLMEKTYNTLPQKPGEPLMSFNLQLDIK